MMVVQSEPLASLKMVWDARESMSFSDWVRRFSDALETSGLTPEHAAAAMGCSTAEVEAATQLALLGESELMLLAKSPPPSTTWFLLAGMSAEKVSQALAALEKRPPGTAPSLVVRGITGHAAEDARLVRVAVLPADAFYHLAKKAKQYDVLYDKARKALYDFGKRRRSNKALTDKQALWAESMIREMIEKGAIRPDSPDGDGEYCNELLKLYET